MSTRGTNLSTRERVVTLVACALLGMEAVPNILLGFVVLSGWGAPSSLLFWALGLIGGGILGVVLLRQGGISIPSRQERGASRGALVGVVVGVILYFVCGGIVSILGICVLVGLAVGRTFDRSSMHPTS